MTRSAIHKSGAGRQRRLFFFPVPLWDGSIDASSTLIHGAVLSASIFAVRHESAISYPEDIVA